MDRPIIVMGVVIHGDARGRTLGFPTANVALPTGAYLPPDGIYAGWLQRAHGQPLPSAISVGLRPTFYDNAEKSMIEVHVLDWSGDLYDEEVTVELVTQLRNQLRFDDVDALIAQMDTDCNSARQILIGN